jgi:Ni2+-binding GTPase involved in maturation of urease and hydrogenase
MTQPVILALVGGFLGAGKTTLIGAAVRRLTARGVDVGVVTNDQAAGLVDSALIAAAAPVEEVAGSCFCCDFDGLVAACTRLQARGRPTVILAEPVGSCTDLAATVIAPLRRLHADRFRLAPYTVLADPLRLELYLAGDDGGFPAPVRHIFHTQLAEAALVALAKADLVAPERQAALRAGLARELPGAELLALSARSGDGVDAWLERILGVEGAAPRAVAVDYPTYAAGEAALGWLNADCALPACGAAGRGAWTRALAADLAARCAAAGLVVAHLKLLVEAGGGQVRAQLTGGAEGLDVSGDAPAAAPARLLVNARVAAEPARLEALVRAALDAAAPGWTAREWRCFAPSEPRPVHRDR